MFNFLLFGHVPQTLRKDYEAVWLAQDLRLFEQIVSLFVHLSSF